MDRQIPTRLSQIPIAEAIVEVRFRSNDEFIVEDEMPVVLSQIFGPWKKLERTSIAEIPRSARAESPDLQFKPIRRIVWDDFLVMVSDSSLAIIVQEPYPGWDDFSQKAIDAITALFELKVTDQVNRVATRYINFVMNRDDAAAFELVTVKFETGAIAINDIGKRIRFEVSNEDVVTVVQINSGQRQEQGSPEINSGLLVDIDAICNKRHETAKASIEALELVHMHEKQMFFDLLTEDSISHYGPVFEGD